MILNVLAFVAELAGVIAVARRLTRAQKAGEL